MIEHDGTYHMYLTYVPGIFDNWNHPRDIVHLTSKDLVKWKKESTLKLASDRVIDACVFRLPEGGWRMWYNNERDKKSIYYADSKDLYTWKDHGKAVGDQPGEGPKVFRWKDRYWMIVDVWQGLGLYQSDDLKTWKRQPGNLLEKPGKGADDGVKGGHPDVLVNGDRAFIFYFTHPGRTQARGDEGQHERRRSSIQVVELEFKDGMITCDRDKPVSMSLEQSAQAEPPKEWIDPDTGHKVVRLSSEPGSQSLYFHQNAYTPDGKKLLITTPTGLCTIDLATREIENVVEGDVRQ